MTDDRLDRVEKQVAALQKESEKKWAWINSHDGRIDAWWQVQHKWNDKLEAWQTQTATRISALERRVTFAAGIAAAAGAMIGSLFQYFR